MHRFLITILSFLMIFLFHSSLVSKRKYKRHDKLNFVNHPFYFNPFRLTLKKKRNKPKKHFSLLFFRRPSIYSNRSASSEQDNSDQSEHSEKSPLVSARLDNLARLFFSKSMPAETGSRDTIDSVLTTRLHILFNCV